MERDAHAHAVSSALHALRGMLLGAHVAGDNRIGDGRAHGTVREWRALRCDARDAHRGRANEAMLDLRTKRHGEWT